MDDRPNIDPHSSGDDSQKSEIMPRPFAAKGAAPKRPELDLSKVIDKDQLKQLMVTMEHILDEMSNSTRQLFDQLKVPEVKPDEGISAFKVMSCSVPNPRSEKYKRQYGDIGLPDEKPDLEDRELMSRIVKPVPPPPGATLVLPNSMQEAIAMTKMTEDERLVKSMSELRKDWNSHFSKWRGAIMIRLRDIVTKDRGTTGNVVNYSSNREYYQRDNRWLKDAKDVTIIHSPPVYCALKDCPKEKRALILHAVFLLFLGLDTFPSYSQVALTRFANSLQVPIDVMWQDEYRVACGMAQVIQGIPASDIAKRRAEEGKPPKRFKGGSQHAAALTAYSGLLAEPLIRAGVGSVFEGKAAMSNTLTAQLLGGVGTADSTVPVGTLFGLYGARQGGKAMDAYQKDIQNWALIPSHAFSETEVTDPKDAPSEIRRLRVTIGISGWATEESDYRHPWRIMGQEQEHYVLRWETEPQQKLGSALKAVALSSAWSSAKTEIAKRSVFASLQGSHWPTVLLQASKIIDNPWTVVFVKSDKAGQLLAEMLMNKVQGERPVTLIGYSLGARIIYNCLMTLAEKRAFGLIENAVLIGTPCPSNTSSWATMKTVVAGRLVNVYSNRDYLLGFLYRTCSWQFGVAGLQKIDGINNRVENCDMGDRVANHGHYQFLVGEILRRLHWEDFSYSESEIDTQKVDNMIAEEAKRDRERHERANSELKSSQAQVLVDRSMVPRAEPSEGSTSVQPNKTRQGRSRNKENQKQRGKNRNNENRKPT
ncbi:DUF726-domain-containing protein [Xylariaceae sp. FL0016]|nr:DUF726-domain-containing protein [Xylariaceae sp. FL0016]